MSRGRTVPSPERRKQDAPVQARMETDPAVAATVREAAGRVLERGKTVGSTLVLAKSASAWVTELVDEFAGGEQVACRAGCAWCCTTTSIATTAPEIIRLAEHLRATRSPEQIETLIDQLARREERLRAMTPERRRVARIPCALLVDKRCSVYEARPVACMGVVSSSAAACEASYRSGWERPIPNGARHLGISVGVRQGVRQALDAAGLDSARLDLTSALRIALTTPNAAERWLAGEAVFEDAGIVD